MMDTAMDLSLRPKESTSDNRHNNLLLVPHFTSSVIRPTPRPPWSILWYQNLLPAFQAQQQHQQLQQQLVLQHQSRWNTDFDSKSTSLGEPSTKNNQPLYHAHQSCRQPVTTTSTSTAVATEPESTLCHHSSQFKSTASNIEATSFGSSDNSNSSKKLKVNAGTRNRHNSSHELGDSDTKAYTSPVVDIACCDGPVHFERVSNPNFAVTVEHHVEVDSSSAHLMRFNNLGPSQDRLEEVNQMEQQHHHQDRSSALSTSNTSAAKTYLCIYCNQSFKSLFCYQKHKKRHLNPVSVDITEVPAVSSRMPSLGLAENKRYNNKTRELNVQFFPCKKCGSKFPSYYFVHKHKKVCH